MKFNNLFRIAAITGILPGIAGCSNHKETKKPNILFIITDDQSPYSLSTYGNQICTTPNIDRLASEGMTITDSYIQGSWQSAVSIPSRTQIMTGRNLWRTVDLPGAKTPVYKTPAEANAAITPDDPQYFSIPAIFNREGYITFRTCKRGTSYENANKLFTYRYDKWCVYADDENGSKWHGDRAMDFLEMYDNEKIEQPFLMYFGFSHPHDPRYEKPEYYEKYGAADEAPDIPNPKSPPLPVNYLPAHPFKIGVDEGRDETQVQGVMRNRDEATIRNEIGRKYACIENIDFQIGRVLNKLDEMGLLENTYIFFCGDNGIAVGRHGLMGKQNLYEHSWRVPLIVRGPGIKAGSRASGFTYLMDVLPTLCDIANIDTPGSCDGISFLPVLHGRKKTIRNTLYGAFTIINQKDDRGQGTNVSPGIRAVRKGKWKLIKYDLYDGTVRQTQLFNLKENPFELLIEHHDPVIINLNKNKPLSNQQNLADNPKYSGRLKKMEKLLYKQQLKYNDPYHLWDQPEQ